MVSRVLKVCGVAPYENIRGKFVEVPCIKLQGKWLEKKGFRVGYEVEVYHKDNEITLKLVNPK